MNMPKILSSLAVMFAIGTAGVSANEIDWWTFTGGGGSAQQGTVAISGAIGPIAPALSPATGGNYTLTGGFWGGLSTSPLPDRPLLSIQLTGGKVQLSWPIGAVGFHLEYTDDLGSGTWQSEPTPVALTEKEHTVTVPPTASHRSYRLRWP